MKKFFLLTACMLGLSLFFTGCSMNENPSNTPDTEENSNIEEPETSKQSKLNTITPTVYSKISGLNLEPGSTISVIGRYSDDSFWTEIEAGAKDAVADINDALGYTGSDKIKLTYSAPGIRDDVDEQINILDEELARYPLAIGIAAIDTSACSLQFDLASENNIPIITFDSGSDYQHVAAHISTNNKEAAATAAAKMAHAIGESGEIAIIVQDSISMTANDRFQGFRETIASDFPEVKVVHTYHLDQLETAAGNIALEMNQNLAEGQEEVDVSSLSQKDIVKWILEKNPNLKGIYATNLDTTQLVADVVTELERSDLKIVGFDGGEEQLALVKDGIVEGLILQNPYGMGYSTVIAAARVALDLGNESVIDTGYVWVTKDNMEETSIANMLY